jgi:rubrerythrin
MGKAKMPRSATGSPRERNKIMEELPDMNKIFDLMKTPEGISPIERLLNEFEAHEAKEEQSIATYKKSLGETANPMTRFLLQMIVSDEEKHRAVVHSMVATLKGSLTWTKPAGSLEGGDDVAGVNRGLRAATEEFIRIEKEGIKEYKTLLEESSGYYHGLFKVLLGSMIRDSEKHVELLEFLKENLASA